MDVQFNVLPDPVIVLVGVGFGGIGDVVPRIAALRKLVPVAVAVAVGVKERRVGPFLKLRCVAQTVLICVVGRGLGRYGAESMDLPPVGETVGVTVGAKPE